MSLHWWYSAPPAPTPISASGGVAFAGSVDLAGKIAAAASGTIQISARAQIGISSGTYNLSTLCQDFGDFVLCLSIDHIEMIGGRYTGLEGGKLQLISLTGWGYLDNGSPSVALAGAAAISGRHRISAAGGVAFGSAAAIGSLNPVAIGTIAFDGAVVIRNSPKIAATGGVAITVSARAIPLADGESSVGYCIEASDMFMPGASSSGMFMPGADETDMFMPGAESIDLVSC